MTAIIHTLTPEHIAPGGTFTPVWWYVGALLSRVLPYSITSVCSPLDPPQVHAVTVFTYCPKHTDKGTVKTSLKSSDVHLGRAAVHALQCRRCGTCVRARTGTSELWAVGPGLIEQFIFSGGDLHDY